MLMMLLFLGGLVVIFVSWLFLGGVLKFKQIIANIFFGQPFWVGCGCCFDFCWCGFNFSRCGVVPGEIEESYDPPTFC